MKALELELNNFRSYDKVTVQLGSGVKVIVGENNVGKSTLLAALQAIRTPSSLLPEDWPYAGLSGPMSIRMRLVLTDQEIRKLCMDLEVPEKDAQYLGNELTLRVNWGGPGTAQTVSVGLGPLRVLFNGTTFLQEFDPTQGFMTVSWAEIVSAAKQGRSSSIWEAAKSKITEYQVRGPNVAVGITFTKNPLVLISGLLQEKIVVFPEFRQRPQGGTATEEFQSPEGTQVASVLFNLKNSPRKLQRRRFVKIQKFFTSLFPTLSLEVVKGPHIIVERAEVGSEIPLNRIGAGIAQIITLLTHLVGSEDMIFALDGPELHLHPHSQRLLRRVLHGSTGNQVIMVTHSPEFIDLSDPYGIILIRQFKGQSRAIQLPQDFISEEERTRLSKIVWSENKDFLFSRRVLLAEGATEFAAIPIIANRLGRNFDENAVSVVAVGGDYFGLFLKILTGFGFPYRVMCDRSALMSIGKGKIDLGTKKIRTSPLFYALWKAGLLTRKDANKLSLAENQISVPKAAENGHSAYSEEQFAALDNISRKYGFWVLDPDFEGFLLKRGLGDLLQDAGHRYPRDKILQGRYLATQMKEIPREFKQVISQVCSLKPVQTEAGPTLWPDFSGK